MFVRFRISSRSISDLVPAALLSLMLLTGCGARLQHASLATNDVCLRLSTLGHKPDRLRCGYYAVIQVVKYYHPEIADESIRTDSLVFVEANDTVSVLHFLRDNVVIPVTMKNEGVDRLLASVASGDPVIVFIPGDTFGVRALNLVGPLVLHCIVVAGHNVDETELFFYSNGEGPYVICRELFARQWARVNNLCILRAR